MNCVCVFADEQSFLLFFSLPLFFDLDPSETKRPKARLRYGVLCLLSWKTQERGVGWVGRLDNHGWDFGSRYACDMQHRINRIKYLVLNSCF